MDFGLSEEQEMLKTAARDFLETECPESVVRDLDIDEDGYSPELWRKIADLGWLGLIYPEEYGGSGMTYLDMAVLYEEMGRGLFTSPHLSTVVLCGLTILNVGSEEQKAELLPKIASGDLILALAMTEPEASWDGKGWLPEGITVPATADGDDYIINGTKLFVHDAHVADYLLCAARTADGATPEQGITLFLVDAKSPGVSYTLLADSVSENKQSEVVFDKMRVPKKNIVGELNGGWSPLFKVVQKGAVLVCAEMVGALQRILEMTADYAQTRHQFDMPIGINQFVQEHCVQLVIWVDSSRWVTYLAAWRLNEDLDCDLEVAIAKAWTSDAYEEACWRSHHVFAGAGAMIDDHLLPLYTRRGNRAKFYLGEPAMWREKAAQELEKLPAPEKSKAPARGLWGKLEKAPVPDWAPWRERAEKIETRKEELRKQKAERKGKS